MTMTNETLRILLGNNRMSARRVVSPRTVKENRRHPDNNFIHSASQSDSFNAQLFPVDLVDFAD